MRVFLLEQGGGEGRGGEGVEDLKNKLSAMLLGHLPFLFFSFFFLTRKRINVE